MSQFDTPPHTHTHDNRLRKIGLEFEMAGITPDKIASCVIECLGGTYRVHNVASGEVTGTKLGDFTIELDAHNMQDLASKHVDQPEAMKLAVNIAELVVPYELVTPPVTLNELPGIENIVTLLQRHQAKGTHSSLLHGFGLHMNPEIVSDDICYIVSTVKAFILLYPWLKKVMEIDLTRRVLSFIDPFPKPYIVHLLQSDYRSNAEFMAEYLAHNPTRNRALDCLPLFAYLDEACVEQLEPDIAALVKPRPAWHYRLPNCDIDNPDWSVAKEWHYWVCVEKLAQNDELIKQLSNEYLTFLSNPLHRLSDAWIERIAEVMHQQRWHCYAKA